MYSIIFALLGFFLTKTSIIGGIIGFLIGGAVDQMQRRKNGDSSQSNGYQNHEDIFDFYRSQSQRYDFPTQLMALSAYIMKSDGRVVKAELNFVKSFFSTQFGPNFNVTHLQSLKRFLDAPNLPIAEICEDIRYRAEEEVRIQLLHYLFGIAQADGSVTEDEIRTLERIAQLLRIPMVDFKSVQGMFSKNIDSDYEVLGIEKTATDDEVKKAYRQMAVRYHPDKVASLGEEYQKGTKEKFQKIQEAYENIKKNRGL